MNKLKISPKETVYYEYDPEADRLAIRLERENGETRQEPIAGLPHIVLSRDERSGEVVGVDVESVQNLILQRLVQDIFFQVLPFIEAATVEPNGPTTTQATVTERARVREAGSGERRAESEEREAESGEQEAESTGSTQAAVTDSLGADVEERTEASRKRRRRRRRKKKGEAKAEGEVTSDRPRRQRRKKSGTAADTDRREGEERRGEPQKHAPIPGLGAPEAFAFMGMHTHLGQVVTALGYEEPTPIQRRAVPEIMAGHDVIGLSQTGTGKTLAFLIPGLHRLIVEGHEGHQPRMLVVAPTRELAVQVAEEAEVLATHTDLRVTTVYGGVSMGKQIKALRRGVDVIVATPGRLLDHIRRNNLRLDEIEVVVLDEADRMLDMGFLPDIRSILNRVPRERQTLLFSATMPPPIESLSLEFQRNPQVIEVARRKPPESIEQFLYPVEKHLKTALLLHLLAHDEEMSRVLVFTETKVEADILARKLREAGVQVALMHGDRNQREREQALQNLRDRRVRVLVATDVAARGLDVEGISHIVNYDMPQSVEGYVHRIGRTARGEATGSAYTFVTLADEGMVKRIESALERTLPRVRAEEFDYDVPTPSWAKPSAEELIERLGKPEGLADRFKRMMGR
ncbi:MAG: DEAD/DEAH box helicase [Chloroflexota bacterium]|nr:DEAD/DEAH box helicase [Chloroflexota bacterium]